MSERFYVHEAAKRIAEIRDFHQFKHKTLPADHPDLEKEYSLYLEYEFILNELIEPFHKDEITNKVTGPL